MTELNGVPADLAQVKALALTNYGHFTSMRVDDQRVRGLSLYLKRLLLDCLRVFDADLDPDRIRHLVRHALVQSSRSVVVRVTVFDPTLELGHLGADAEPHVLVTTRPAAQTPSPALRLQSAAYRRDMPEVKHVGLFGSLQRRRIAQRNGFVDGGRIVWLQANCLPGVTMRLINQARDGQAITTPVTLGQLADQDCQP